MSIRPRLAMGATALLYMGPLLAGLAGYGWGLVVGFAVIFLLWLIVMRPAMWPRDPAVWKSSEVWVPALGQFAAQVLLIVVCFGIGRGIGGVVGVVPMLSPIAPLAISFVAVPLTRLLWPAPLVAGAAEPAVVPSAIDLFEECGSDPDRLHMFASRAIGGIDDPASGWVDLPAPAVIRSRITDDLPTDVALLLERLAQRIEATDTVRTEP